MGRSGMPKAFASAKPNCKNSSVHRVTVGTPLFSSSMASWILHEVHDPQSPMALTTPWHSFASSSINAAGSVGRGLAFDRIPIRPYFFCKRFASRDKRISAFGFPFCLNPMTFPFSSPRRGAGEIGKVLTRPSGTSNSTFSS